MTPSPLCAGARTTPCYSPAVSVFKCMTPSPWCAGARTTPCSSPAEFIRFSFFAGVLCAPLPLNWHRRARMNEVTFICIDINNVIFLSVLHTEAESSKLLRALEEKRAVKGGSRSFYLPFFQRSEQLVAYLLHVERSCAGNGEGAHDTSEPVNGEYSHAPAFSRLVTAEPYPLPCGVWGRRERLPGVPVGGGVGPACARLLPAHRRRHRLRLDARRAALRHRRPGQRHVRARV
eukprot:1187098-Prorocentrum_minimum.AAC.7